MAVIFFLAYFLNKSLKYITKLFATIKWFICILEINLILL